MTTFTPKTFQIYQAGELTVVGFEAKTSLHQIDLALCREELAKLVEENQTRFLAFDLTNIRVFPSGMLGLLASLRRLDVEVHLYNASSDIVEVLEITGLKRFMQLHQVSL
ncbi:STAS domain-containing protein [Thalassoroseus pseudoceratinae]|uniref:STAS domain-containing protein n=1 Tax=Thalassoroseus pseudoceratinae TaxID=2713176 RepID=UPI00142292C5|nr:STAS domain-containing protein [Thalassoroseus pseudoceratinae]